MKFGYSKDLVKIVIYIVKLILTTKQAPGKEEVETAVSLARSFNLNYIERRNYTLNYLNKKTSTDGALVVKGENLELVSSGKRLYFHPNLAVLRILELKRGNRDRLLDIMGVNRGDSVLDCTCGLGSDSIVLSYGVGDMGKITSLESSSIIWEIVKRGFKYYSNSKFNLKKDMSRIELLNINYWDYLVNIPDKSYDYIYFDPMFKTTRERSQGLEIVRELANYDPLTREVLDVARMKSRKGVVIKTNSANPLLKALEIPLIFKSSKVSYGKL